MNRAVLVLAAAATPFGMAAMSAAVTAPAKAASSLVTDLHVAITKHQSSDVIVPLVERAMRQAGRACAPLRDYQLLSGGGDVQTLKIKCAEKPTYALTVSLKRGVRVTGGDGSIAPINPQDGPVTAVWGMRAERYLADEARRRSQPAAPATAQHRPAAKAGISAWGQKDWGTVLWAGLLLTLLLALPLLVWFNSRPSQVPGFTSQDKDRMLEQSEQVLPEIYRHPQGWFIVRGQRGKRRVFRTLLFAYLYRNYGVKLREVR